MPQTLPREKRLPRAKNWVAKYTGSHIVKAYKKRYGVDQLCAMTELKMLGVDLDSDYVERATAAEMVRRTQLLEKKQERKEREWLESHADQDDRFFFIAGYTSNGGPYGVTWEEMGLEPYENEFDDDGDIVCYRHYEFLNKREKDNIDNRLREDFWRYVSTYRRLPNKGKQRRLIEKVFESCPGGPLLYSKDFNIVYRKIVRKRENKFIRDGVLPKRFTPTEIKKLFGQSIVLESERLIFRKIKEDDFSDLTIMLRDPEIMAVWEYTFSDEQIQKWINNQIERY